MKGCLKQCSRAPSPTLDHHSSAVKHVAFDADGSEQIFLADEWDRTPAEPARHLSYQDILELKEIQRSLPRAIQPADLIGSKPASHYLSTVPIGLLPLLPESDNTPPQPTNTVASTLTFSQNSWRTVRTPAPSIPRQHQPQQPHPSHLAHLPPARPPINRPKGRFAFLPLLDQPQTSPTTTTTMTRTPTPTPPGSRSRTPSPPASPPPSERSSSPDFFDTMSHDPPTPALTNASVDSSPLSRSSSCSPEPTFLQLPPSCAHGRFCGVKSNNNKPTMTTDDRLSLAESWMNMRNGGDPHDYRRPGFGASRSPFNATTVTPTMTPPAPSTPPKKKRGEKKNVIVINDIEIELDDDNQDQGQDDDEEAESSTPPAKAPSIPHSNSLSFSSSSSPTTRPYIPPTRSINAHSPICFKRSTTPTQSSASAGGGGAPPAAPGHHSSPVLVPSA